MHKNIITLERLFDLQDKFKRPTNMKISSSSLRYEVVNLGTEKNPQKINLGTNCTHSKKESFMRLFREYKDVFAWTYEDLKTYDMKIIQHKINHEKNHYLDKDSRPHYPTSLLHGLINEEWI